MGPIGIRAGRVAYVPYVHGPWPVLWPRSGTTQHPRSWLRRWL